MSPIRTSIEDRIFFITLDHPPTNALDPQTLVELESAVNAFLADSSCAAAVIASANRAIFSSGADLPVYAAMESPEELMAYIHLGQSIRARITGSPKPFIAAVNGLAVGGGLELALMCHLRVAYEQARLGLPEITYGIIPGWGGTQMLPRLVGPARTAELILLGETISAQEALQIGLVNKIVPRSEVLPAAKELASKIASRNPLSVSAALTAIRAASEPGDGYAVETAQMAALIHNEDILVTIRDILARQKPAP